MEVKDCSKNPLPLNFDKYSNIIKYFRGNGLDCLSSLEEQFRFFIRYIYSKYTNDIDFHERLKSRTNLLYKDKYDNWGKWNADIHVGHYFYDINSLTFYDKYVMRSEDYNVPKEFLYEQLSAVSDDDIMKYCNELRSYGKLCKIEKIPDYIIITNKFNDSKILVEKHNLENYCGYNKFVDDYNLLMDEKIKTFNIDVEFNDKVALDISTLLNEGNIPDTNSIEEFQQQSEVMDFLQININYDAK